MEETRYLANSKMILFVYGTFSHGNTVPRIPPPRKISTRHPPITPYHHQFTYTVPRIPPPQKISTRHPPITPLSPPIHLHSAPDPAHSRRPSHLHISFSDLLVPTNCAHSYYSSSLFYKEAKSDFAGLLCPRESKL